MCLYKIRKYKDKRQGTIELKRQSKTVSQVGFACNKSTGVSEPRLGYHAVLLH